MGFDQGLDEEINEPHIATGIHGIDVLRVAVDHKSVRLGRDILLDDLFRKIGRLDKVRTHMLFSVVDLLSAGPVRLAGSSARHPSNVRYRREWKISRDSVETD